MSGDRFPQINVNLEIIKNNARVLCDILGGYGISVAGVVKFSDGDVNVAKAYWDGGCSQIAVSRAVHLKPIKEFLPNADTLLTRSPTRAELEDVAKYADISLHSDRDVLCALNEAASGTGKTPGIILMFDVGDLREGVDNIAELTELAVLVENELGNLRLLGVGTNLACLNGVLPDYENLSLLVSGAEAVEAAIGRRLDIISGGSSINLILLKDGVNKMPERVNHLRLGGPVANPFAIRVNRGVSFNGMREDGISITAEIVEIHEKDSAPRGTLTKNWAGKTIETVDNGRRIRAILAIGDQDTGGSSSLIPLDDGVTIVGSSSDHTIVDVTDSGKQWRSGDTMTFRVKYAAMLYAFSGKHVNVKYIK